MILYNQYSFLKRKVYVWRFAEVDLSTCRKFIAIISDLELQPSKTESQALQILLYLFWGESFITYEHETIYRVY